VIEQYPVFANKPGTDIPDDTFKERSGLHAVRYIVNENEKSMET
jgi:hypothetical protein